MSWPAQLSQSDRLAVIKGAKWSKMAYSDADANADADVRDLTYVACEGCDAQCIIFDTSDRTLVIAVRGTTSVEDMLCDVRVVQTLLDDIPNVYVHSGFRVQFEALSLVVQDRVIKHLAGGGQLVCTGHSLGAGVAALFAVSYGTRFPHMVSYFGYGSPRQGNLTFKKLMDSETRLAVSVKNHRDPVCASIPSVCLPSRYNHAGVHMYIGEDPHPYLPDILYVRDHDISQYVANLERALEDI